jgi:NADPH-dependent 2,4-dienoyl-CoA reductase/sulfur reductase-like enzyme
MAPQFETEKASSRPQTNGIKATSERTELLPQDCVLIVGGGPVGLKLATVLAYYGVKSIVLERNESTTKSVATLSVLHTHFH